MTGKIVKGIGGFYYVVCGNGAVYECKARGSFRNQGIRPLVGDNVEIDVLDDAERLGSITELYPRKNWLIRPAAANVDQTVILFAVASPEPNFHLLDRFLVTMEQRGIPVVICFNKTDLDGFRRNEAACRSYQKTGYEVLFISAKNGYGIQEFFTVLRGKTTVFAGPSGVGKSSVLNALFPEGNAKTGDLSEKLQRGKHTTRHSELMPIAENTFLMDTPGFSSLSIEGLDAENLKEYFPEIAAYAGMCRFHMCSHIYEPGCLVKQAVSDGTIAGIRYDDYVRLYMELKEKRKW